MLSRTEFCSPDMVATFLLDIVFLLTAAVIAVPVFRALGLGIVPGFLVAGILVGPSGLGLIDNFYEIRQLAELGVVLLLFVIGIAYVFIARGDLVRNRDLIAVGALYKLAYFSVALWYLIDGVYPHIVFFVVFGLADLVFFVAMTECWWFVRRLDAESTSR